MQADRQNDADAQNAPPNDGDDQPAPQHTDQNPFVEDLGDNGDDDTPPRPKSLIQLSSSDSSHTVHTEHFDITFTPNRPGRTMVFRRKGSDGRTLTGVPDDQPDPRMIHHWVDQTDHEQGLSGHSSPDSVAPPTVTRSGPASKTTYEI